MRSEGEEDEPLFGAKKPPRAKAADAEGGGAGGEGAAAADGVVATVTLTPGEPPRRRWYQRGPADAALTVRCLRCPGLARVAGRCGVAAVGTGGVRQRRPAGLVDAVACI